MVKNISQKEKTFNYCVFGHPIFEGFGRLLSLAKKRLYLKILKTSQPRVRWLKFRCSTFALEHRGHILLLMFYGQTARNKKIAVTDSDRITV